MRERSSLVTSAPEPPQFGIDMGFRILNNLSNIAIIGKNNSLLSKIPFMNKYNID